MCDTDTVWMLSNTKKVWSRMEAREVIAARQRRDYDRLAVDASSRSVRYLAARCMVRYAQEAMLDGNVTLRDRFLNSARNFRDTARSMPSACDCVNRMRLR